MPIYSTFHNIKCLQQTIGVQCNKLANKLQNYKKKRLTSSIKWIMYLAALIIRDHLIANLNLNHGHFRMIEHYLLKYFVVQKFYPTLCLNPMGINFISLYSSRFNIVKICNYGLMRNVFFWQFIVLHNHKPQVKRLEDSIDLF